MRKLFLFILFSFFSITSFADILFIDLNYSINEVQAIREYARTNKIKLHLFPERTPQDEKKLEPIWRRLDTLHTLRKNCKKNCERIDQEINQRIEEMQNIVKEKIAKVDAAEFKRITSLLNSNNVSLQHVIFSGHSGGSFFSGVFGNLNLSEIKEGFDSNINLIADTQSILIWGCYGGTLNSLYNSWRLNFPLVKMFAGYENRSPLGIRDSSAKYLIHTLKAQKNILSKTTAKDIHTEFRRIPLTAELDGTALVGDIFVSYDKFGNVKEMLEKCNNSFPQDLYEKFICYDEGKEGCENPPANHQGPLRDFYSYLQINRHCSDLIREDYPNIPTPEYLIRLIYLDNIKSNYLAKHKNTILQFNKVLNDLHFDSKFYLENYFKETRKSNLALSQDFKTELSFSTFFLMDTIPNEELLKYSLFQIIVMSIDNGPLHNYAFQRSQSDGFCIPFSWVDRGATEEDTCGVDEYFQTPIPKPILIQARSLEYWHNFSRFVVTINPTLLMGVNLPPLLTEQKKYYAETLRKDYKYYQNLPEKFKNSDFAIKQIQNLQNKLTESETITNEQYISATIHQVDLIINYINNLIGQIEDANLKNQLQMSVQFYIQALENKKKFLSSGQ